MLLLLLLCCCLCTRKVDMKYTSPSSERVVVHRPLYEFFEQMCPAVVVLLNSVVGSLSTRISHAENLPRMRERDTSGTVVARQFIFIIDGRNWGDEGEM